jgi:hypothetical protein
VGGFLGIGGKNSKQQNQAAEGSFNLFNQNLQRGGMASAAGGARQDTGAGYFEKLTSGNRPAMMQAIAPEANAVQSQTDAGRRQLEARGTSRGGGTAGANQTLKDAEMARIDNALFGVRPAAAKEIGDIGARQIAQGTQNYSIAGSAAGTEGNIAAQGRQQAMDAQNSIISDMLGFIPKSKGP